MFDYLPKIAVGLMFATAFVYVLSFLLRNMVKKDEDNLVQIKMKYPLRKLSKTRAILLKHTIKQRLSDTGPDPSDPYLVIRNAQVGKRDAWKEFVEKEKKITPRPAVRKKLKFRRLQQ